MYNSRHRVHVALELFPRLGILGISTILIISIIS